jgi:hypothetical protein
LAGHTRVAGQLIDGGLSAAFVSTGEETRQGAPCGDFKIALAQAKPRPMSPPVITRFENRSLRFQRLDGP